MTRPMHCSCLRRPLPSAVADPLPSLTRKRSGAAWAALWRGIGQPLPVAAAAPVALELVDLLAHDLIHPAARRGTLLPAALSMRGWCEGGWEEGRGGSGGVGGWEEG